MGWFTDSGGFPRAERVLLAVGATFAAAGWFLAIWVDPGAINMAVAGSIITIGGGVATLITAVRR